MRKSKTEQSGPDNPRPFGTSLDENGELLGGETSCRFGPLLSRGFSLTRPARSQSRRSYQNAPRGLFRRAVITVSQAATGLLALAMLMFTATLSAQRLVHAAARVQCGGAAGGRLRGPSAARHYVHIRSCEPVWPNRTATKECSNGGRPWSGICRLGRASLCFGGKLPFAQRQGRFFLRSVDSKADGTRGLKISVHSSLSLCRSQARSRKPQA